MRSAVLEKLLGTEAAEDSAQAMKRAVKGLKRSFDKACDVRDDIAHDIGRRVRREPLRLTAVALGAGILVGGMIGWAVSARLRTR